MTNEADGLAAVPGDLGKCLFCGTPLSWQTDDIDGWIAHLYCVGCDFLGPISDFKYEDVEEAKADSWSRWTKGIAPTPAARMLAGEGEAFQQRVQPWMMECFGAEISGDMLERADRFTEEALELAQTMPGFTAARAHALVDYVFGRDVGEREQEVGGVMVTLAALCLAADIDMHEAGETELARILQPHIVEKIRTKQAAKPRGSALPIAHPPAAEPVGLREALTRIDEGRTGGGGKSLPYDAHSAQRIARQALATPARTDDAGVGGERDYVAEKLHDDLNEILSPFHWEAWQAALFSDLDHWPEEDEQEAIARGVDGVAVGEHYQAWSEDVRAKIVALFPSSPAPDRGEGE